MSSSSSTTKHSNIIPATGHDGIDGCISVLTRKNTEKSKSLKEYLFVFDLHDTLCSKPYFEPKRRFRIGDILISARSGRRVMCRNHAISLLSELHTRGASIAFWSSCALKNITPIVDYFRGNIPGFHPQFVFSRNECQTSRMNFSSKKDLSRIPLLSHTKHLVMVDNSCEKLKWGHFFVTPETCSTVSTSNHGRVEIAIVNGMDDMSRYLVPLNGNGDGDNDNNRSSNSFYYLNDANLHVLMDRINWIASTVH